jgi:hypothetical protein
MLVGAVTMVDQAIAILDALQRNTPQSRGETEEDLRRIDALAKNTYVAVAAAIARLLCCMDVCAHAENSSVCPDITNNNFSVI